MPDKDKELIVKAEKLKDIDWSVAYNLIDKAESDEAKEILRSIGKNLYRAEEFSAGIL